MLTELPPLQPVSAIVADFESRGWPVALGGSAVLAALGLVETVRDWDVTVEAAPDAVLAALRALGLSAHDATTPEPPFATAARLVVEAGDHELDVLVGFALRDGDAVWPVPVRVWRHWQGLPVAHPGDWVRAYRLMGRTERAAALAAHPEASAWMEP